MPSFPPPSGLIEYADENGERALTNVTSLEFTRPPAGRRLVNTAAILLAVLDLGLFAVSFAAQNQYIYHAKHQAWPALTEAAALDAGMMIFSLLALGLARGGQSARTERTLILLCAAGSAAMNYAAADVTSVRSVAAYVMPPVFLAIVTDRVIAVIRRHVLGMDAERSAWAAAGRAAVTAAAGAGKALLYGVRLVLAPRSTFGGARTLVLLATPLPGAHVLAAEHARLDAARTALGTVHAQISGELRDGLRAEAEAMRDTVRTEIEAVREAARADAPGPALAALGERLRDLREQHDLTAAALGDGLRATREAFRTEAEAVRETLRTEIEAVRDTARAEAAWAPVPRLVPSPASGTTRGAHDPAASADETGSAAHDQAASATGDGDPARTAAPASCPVPVASFRAAPQEPGAGALLLLGEAEIQFADMLADRKVPSQRQIMAGLHVGSARAREVWKHLTTLAATGCQPLSDRPPLTPEDAAAFAGHAARALPAAGARTGNEDAS